MTGGATSTIAHAEIAQKSAEADGGGSGDGDGDGGGDAGESAGVDTSSGDGDAISKKGDKANGNAGSGDDDVDEDDVEDGNVDDVDGGADEATEHSRAALSMPRKSHAGAWLHVHTRVIRSKHVHGLYASLLISV